MPRGKASEIGDRTVNANGYEQIKTEEGWIGLHVHVMQEHLGRQLSKTERVRFKDGDRTNFALDNLEIYILKGGSAQRRLAVVEDKIRELLAEKENLERFLKDKANEGRA